MKELDAIEGYKRSKLGCIPMEWDVVKMTDLCENNKDALKPGPFGSSLRKEYFIDNGYKVYGQEQVIPNDFSIGEYYISEEKYRELEAFKIKPGDLLISLVGTFGKIAIVPENAQPGIINPRLMKISFDRNKAIAKFYNHFMSSELFYAQLINMSHGGTMGIINSSVLKSAYFVKPLIAEQHKIAEILSTVDEQISLSDALIKKTKELKKGLMQQLLTRGIGHTRFKQTELGEIPEEWEVTYISDITLEHKQGYYTQEKYVKDGTYLIRITDMNNPEISFLDMPKVQIDEKTYEQFQVEEDDFLFARSGAIGRYGIYSNPEQRSIFGSYIIRFRFDRSKVDNRYFGYFYESALCVRQIKSITQGSSNININANNIKGLTIAIPKLSEQKKIADILSAVDEQIDQTDALIEKTKVLKKGLMQKLLTGQIRVKVS